MSKVEYSNTTFSFGTLAELLTDEVETFILKDVVITGDDDALYSFWRVLRGHPSLKNFSWSNVTFEDKDADVTRLISVLFIAVAKLERVHLDNMHVPVVAISAAEYCDHLREIYLVNDHYTDEEAAKIAQALANNKHINKVDFRGNDLTEQGNVAFKACLNLNKSIADLCPNTTTTTSKKNKLCRQNSATAA